MCFPLKNKVSLITGSSRGIGKAIALKLANLGSDIIVNYVKNQTKALELVEEIKLLGVKAIAIQADIGEADQIKEMFKIIKDEFKQLDILINNAAFGALGPSMRIGKFTWNMTMSLNTGGLLLCTQNAVKLMNNGGRIVNISSLGSQRCIPDYMPIGTAKAAIETMTKYLACELIEKNIYVNAVSGGFIDTEALDIFKNIENLKEKSIKKTPAGRLGTAEDIAKIVAFLCNEDSNWIIGQTIVADGGMSLKF
ncbi:SDR family oxidoreductase [bacterium]|nr:MAG: SDR family oxidoreductase [bacterium]